MTFGLARSGGLFPIRLPLCGLRVVYTLDTDLLEEDLFNTVHSFHIFSQFGTYQRAQRMCKLVAF